MSANKKLFLVIALAFAVRLVWFLFTDNYIDGDAPARLRVAWAWSQHPVWFPSTDWLPMHFYYTGGLLRLFQDPVYIPRLFSLMFSVFTIIPLYLFLKGEFDEEIAFYSVLQYALFHTQIIISSLTLTEVPFLFFLFTGLLFLQKAIVSKHWFYLPAAIISFTLINLFRFEGWIFTALAGFWFLAKSKHKISFLFFGLLTSIAPLAVMYATYQIKGNPFDGITFSDYEVRSSILELDLSLFIRLLGFWFAFPFLFLFTIPFTGKFIKTPSARRYLILALPATFYALYKIINGTLTPSFRYFIVYAVLLSPIVVQVYLYWHQKLRVRLRPVVFVIVMEIITEGFIGAVYVVRNLHYENNLNFKTGFMESAKYVREQLPNTRIMLDQDGFSANAWMVYANMPLVDKDTSNSTGVAYWISGRTWLDERLDTARLFPSLQSRKILHIVLFKDGELNSHFHFKTDTVFRGGFTFVKEFEKNGYQIYGVKK